MNEHDWKSKLKEEADDVLFRDLNFDERMKQRVRERIRQEQQHEGTVHSTHSISSLRPSFRSRFKRYWYGAGIAASLVVAVALSSHLLFDSDEPQKLVGEMTNNAHMYVESDMEIATVDTMSTSDNSTDMGAFTDDASEMTTDHDLDGTIGMIPGDSSQSPDASVGGPVHHESPGVSPSIEQPSGTTYTALVELDSYTEAVQWFGEDLLVPEYIPAGYKLDKIVTELPASDDIREKLENGPTPEMRSGVIIDPQRRKQLEPRIHANPDTRRNMTPGGYFRSGNTVSPGIDMNQENDLNSDTRESFRTDMNPDGHSMSGNSMSGNSSSMVHGSVAGVVPANQMINWIELRYISEKPDDGWMTLRETKMKDESAAGTVNHDAIAGEEVEISNGVTGYLRMYESDPVKLELKWFVGEIELTLTGTLDREELLRVARSVTRLSDQ